MSNSATRQPFEGTETFAERNPLRQYKKVGFELDKTLANMRAYWTLSFTKGLHTNDFI